MDQVQQDVILEESVKQVMQTLPPPIRDYVAQGKYTAVAKALMVKYNLHLDQGTVLEREIMLLLMGIENPEEFAQSLVEEAKIDEQIIGNIVQDINDQIFVPLQKEMQKGAEILAKQGIKLPEPPKPPPRENVVIPPPRSVIIPANPRMPGQNPVETETLSEEWLRPAPAPIKKPIVAQQVNASMPRYVPPRPSPKVVENAPRPVATTALKPPVDEKLLEDHEEPHIEFNKTPMPPLPSRTAPPPPNLPGVMLPPGEVLGILPPPVVPKIESPVQPIKPKPTSPVVSTGPVLSKPYLVDPYREPIDEN